MNFEAVAVRREAAATSERTAPPKISCRKLDFFYGKFQALKNVERRTGAPALPIVAGSADDSPGDRLMGP